MLELHGRLGEDKIINNLIINNNLIRVIVMLELHGLVTRLGEHKIIKKAQVFGSGASLFHLVLV